MKSLVGKKFQNQDVVVDASTAYIKCKFTGCNMIYMGGDFTLANCSLDNCQISIMGEATKVLGFMQSVGMIVPTPALPPAAQLPESGTLH